MECPTVNTTIERGPLMLVIYSSGPSSAECKLFHHCSRNTEGPCGMLDSLQVVDAKRGGSSDIDGSGVA